MKMPKPRAKYDPRKQGAKFKQMELNNFGSVYCSVSFLQSPGYVQTPRSNLQSPGFLQTPSSNQDDVFNTTASAHF